MSEQMTTEEIEKLLRQQRELFERGLISSRDWADAQKDAAAGIRGYTQNLRNSLDKLGSSFMNTNKAIYEGQRGSAVYNDTLKSGADAVSAFMMRLGPAGIAVGLFTKAVASYYAAASDQSDKLYKSFAEMSRAGVLGRDSMHEVYTDMKDFGYASSQLGEMGSFLAKNSKALAGFGKSADGGARQLAELANGIQNTNLRGQLMQLGLGTTDINQASAGYLTQLGRLGRATQATTAGAVAYIKEMETLTRLTGQNREEIEAQREQLESIDSYNATLQDLQRGNEKAYNTLQVTMTRLGSVDPTGELSKGFAEIIGSTGIATSEAAQKVYGATGYAVEEIKRKLTSGEYKNSDDAIRDFNAAIQRNAQMQKGLTHIGSQFGLSQKSTIALNNEAAKSYVDNAAAVDAQTKGYDQTTMEAVKQREAQQNQATAMDSFVNLGVKPATKVTRSFAEAMESVVRLLPMSEEDRKRSDAQVEANRRTREEELQKRRLNPNGSNAAVPNAPAANTGEQRNKQFFDKLSKAAEDEARKAGLSNPEVIGKLAAAQASLESNYGRQGLANNLFGVKAQAGQPAVEAMTTEVDRQGVRHRVKQQFRAYESEEDSVRDYVDFLIKNKRYKDVLAASNLQQAIAAQGQTGYATDPEYAAKMAAIAKQNLAQPTAPAAPAPAAGAESGKILSGPVSGYKPNLTMHGTEAVVPLNNEAQKAAAGMPDTTPLIMAQIDKLDEMIAVMKNQLGISTRIMQATV